jgi:hypothetical protein
MQVQQNKERLSGACFPTHRKERDGMGTQFHPDGLARPVRVWSHPIEGAGKFPVDCPV